MAQPNSDVCAVACGISPSSKYGRARIPDSSPWRLCPRPLVKRPKGTTYKTLLSLDGGGVRGIVSTMVLIELEHSIKQYLLEHPQLLPDNIQVTGVNDFDINLADYFDCMTGASAGSWSTMYLATRGGKGASRAVLDDPAVVKKYGHIPNGGAEGLRVFYKEYSSKIYPIESITANDKTPSDGVKSDQPGISAPYFGLDGLESSLEAFLGRTTLKDADTSLLVPAFDLMADITIYFVQNAFKSPPVTSCAKLFSRASPLMAQQEGEKVKPALVFDEGKDYCLKDVGAGSGAIPVCKTAKAMTQADSDVIEFQLVDGAIVVECVDFPAALFVSRETSLHSFDKLAILSLGTGKAKRDRSFLKNAGMEKWTHDLTILDTTYHGGNRTMTSLLEFMYYNSPHTKPYQYLRINVEAPLSTDEGAALATTTRPEYVHDLEAIGVRLAKEHRPLIDVFVKEFIFA